MDALRDLGAGIEAARLNDALHASYAGVGGQKVVAIDHDCHDSTPSQWAKRGTFPVGVFAWYLRRKQFLPLLHYLAGVAGYELAPRERPVTLYERFKRIAEEIAGLPEPV